MATPLSTISKEMFACPKCKAPIGEYCVTPKGKPARGLIGGVHGARTDLVPMDSMMDSMLQQFEIHTKQILLEPEVK